MLKSAAFTFTEPICPCVEGSAPAAFTYNLTGFSNSTTGAVRPESLGMTIACPKCKTTWTIPPGQLKLQFLYDRTTTTPEEPKESPMARRMDLMEGA